MALHACRRYAATVVLCCAAWLAAFPLHAAPLQLAERDTQTDVASHVEILEDRDATLRIEDVAQRPFPPAAARETLNLGYSASAWWLRLDIETGQAGTRYLEIAYPSLDTVELFVPQGKGYRRLAAGDLLPFAERPLLHHNLVFPLELPAGTTRLHVRVASTGGLILPTTLWEPQAFLEHTLRDYAAQFLYFGMLLALGLYNLLLFFRLRERIYLLYVLFLSTMGIGVASLHGFTGQFVWPRAEWAHYAITVGMGLSGLMAACFSRTFLNLQRHLPRADKVFVFWMAWYAVSILLSFAAYRLAEELISLGSIGFCLTAFITGILSLRHGEAGARFYLLAWTALLAGSTMLAARNFGWVPLNALTAYGFQIGSALEMLLLSYALADRLQTLKRLEFEAKTDLLTGLNNRRSFFELGQTELKRAARYGRPLSAAIIDIDHFKSINDTYGHIVGDQVLIALTRALSAELRNEDVLGRLGGEEFGLVMPETNLAAAKEVCERIRTAIETLSIDTCRATLQATVSIGVTEWRAEEEDFDTLLQRADDALYEAKRTGRNLVFINTSAMPAAAYAALTS